MEVTIIGAGGTIGCTAAYTLATERPEFDITLTDIDEDLVSAHAIDIRHGRTMTQLPSFTPKGRMGAVETVSSMAAAVETADIAVVTASVPRPTGAAKRGGRAYFLEQNQDLAERFGEVLAEQDPLPIIVVTNPVDHITYHLWQAAGWDRSWFLGYSLSETVRTVDRIAYHRDVRASSIYCPVVGEHGEQVVPLFSRATIDGKSVSLTVDERHDIREYVRNIPYDIIELRGQAETSRWVTGQGVARLTQAVVDDGIAGEPIALSVPLDGEYGFTDVCLSVPVRFGRDGINEILEWDLLDHERARLEEAYESISSAL